MQKMILLLSILEPLVVNEENTTKAIGEDIVPVLGKLILLNDPFFEGLFLTGDSFKNA